MEEEGAFSRFRRFCRLMMGVNFQAGRKTFGENVKKYRRFLALRQRWALTLRPFLI